MTNSRADRIPCVNPRCRRTADAAKHDPGDEIVCGKCWRNLPRPLRDRYRQLARRSKRLQRLVAKRIAKRTITSEVVDRVGEQIDREQSKNWRAIRNYFIVPERPIGIEGFLAEIGL